MKVTTLLKHLQIPKEVIEEWMRRNRICPSLFRICVFLYLTEQYGIRISQQFMNAPINDPYVRFTIKKIMKIRGTSK